MGRGRDRCASERWTKWLRGRAVADGRGVGPAVGDWSPPDGAATMPFGGAEGLRHGRFPDGGVAMTSTYTALDERYLHPLADPADRGNLTVLVRGRGVHVEDAEGRRYI